jgi:hypothetical protein
LPFVKARRAAFEGAAQGAAVSLTLNQSSREITVVGDRPAVIAVIEAIKSTVEEYGSTLQQLPTSLPKRQHRLLTGKNADEIMAETKCAIIVADPDDESNAITVWGKPEDLGAGITAALSKANSQYIHEFPLPGPAATSRQIATYMINIDYPQKLSQEHWGVHVYLPSAAAIAKAQSISLDILGEKTTVDAAVRQVSELIGKLIGAVDEVKADWLLHRTLQGTKNSKKSVTHPHMLSPNANDCFSGSSSCRRLTTFASCSRPKALSYPLSFSYTTRTPRKHRPTRSRRANT